MVGFIFDVNLHCIFAYSLENHFSLLDNILGNLEIKDRRFLRTNGSFQVRYFVRNTSVEQSTRFTLNACVVGRVLV